MALCYMRSDDTEYKAKQDKIERLAATFRSNLRKYRKDQHLTQERLAEMATIDPRYYRKIERGENNPTIVYAYLLSEALEVSLDELFYEQKGDF